MKRTHVLTILAMAMLLCALMVSCASQSGSGDLDAYEAANMTIVQTDPGTGEVVATFTFEYGDGDTAILTKYEGKALTGDVVILPDSFEQRRVVGVGSNAFYHLASIKEVKLPDTLEYIDSFAFAECPELVKVTLPDSLTDIRASAFAGCPKLETVALGADSALETIGARAFWNCSSLKELDLPTSLKSIGDAAFWGCASLQTVELPDSVTSLGSLAYYNCTGLTSIKLTDNLGTIGEFAFVLDGSTLKDKIDLSGITNQTILDYVANMAEPTVVETETETGADIETAEPETRPADPLADPSTYLQELVGKATQEDGLTINSTYTAERYVGEDATPATVQRESVWSHVGSDYLLSGQYVLLQDTLYLPATGLQVKELTAAERGWIAEHLFAESVLPFAPTGLQMKAEKAEEGVCVTVSGLSEALKSTLIAQLEAGQTVKSVEAVEVSGTILLDANGRLASVTYSLTVSGTTSDDAPVRMVFSYENSYSYGNTEAITVPAGGESFTVSGFADALGYTLSEVDAE